MDAAYAAQLVEDANNGDVPDDELELLRAAWGAFAGPTEQHPNPVDANLTVLIGENQAEKLATYSTEEIANMPEMGLRDLGLTAKSAKMIRAAVDFAIEAARATSLVGEVITGPESIADVFRSRLVLLQQEEFWGLTLNARNAVVAEKRMFVGGASLASVDVRLFFQWVLSTRGHKFIIVHNHPTGSPEPSDVDDALVKQLKFGAQTLRLEMQDSVVLSKSGFVSMRERSITKHGGW